MLQKMVHKSEVLQRYVASQLLPHENDLFDSPLSETIEVLDALNLRFVFDGVVADFEAWKSSSAEAARLIWEAKTERRKLSAYAQEFFLLLAQKFNQEPLLRKGKFHNLVAFAPVHSIAAEVTEKLDALHQLFENAASIAHALNVPMD